MNEKDNASNQNNENLGIKLIILGSMITRIGDAISSIASTFNLDETNDVNNQQYFEEQEQKLQTLINEMNDFTKEILAQMS